MVLSLYLEKWALPTCGTPRRVTQDVTHDLTHHWRNTILTTCVAIEAEAVEGFDKLCEFHIPMQDGTHLYCFTIKGAVDSTFGTTGYLLHNGVDTDIKVYQPVKGRDVAWETEHAPDYNQQTITVTDDGKVFVAQEGDEQQPTTKPICLRIQLHRIAMERMLAEEKKITAVAAAEWAAAKSAKCGM